LGAAADDDYRYEKNDEKHDDYRYEKNDEKQIDFFHILFIHI